MCSKDVALPMVRLDIDDVIALGYCFIVHFRDVLRNLLKRNDQYTVIEEEEEDRDCLFTLHITS